DGYYFNRLSSYIDKFVPHGSWYPDKKLRLFNKEKGRWGGQNPHDAVVLLSDKKKFLKGNLNHYTYYSISEHAAKVNYFSTISAQEAFDAGNVFRFSDLFIKPFWRFFRDYFIKHGFLGGFRGLTISVLSATETYLKIIKLWELEKINQEKSDRQALNRIVHVCAEKSWRGGEQQLAYLIEELRKRDFYNLVVCKEGSAFEKYCLFNGIDYEALPLLNSVDIFSAFELKNICHKAKANILHLHSSKAHSIAAFSNLFGNRTKMVVTRRVIFDIKNHQFSLWKYKLRSVKKVIAISNAIYGHLKSYGLKDNKLRTIYSGISLDQSFSENDFSIREKYGIPTDHKLIGNISALTEEKDIETFLRVAEKILHVEGKVNFIIYGTGDMEQELKNLAKELKIDDRVIFAGFKKDVKKVVSQFDIFLFTSKKEGLGTSVLDAMVAGTTVVSTNAGGLKETITHDQDGFLCEVGDVESLAASTLKLIRDDSLRKEMGERARENVKKFDIHRMGEKTVELYKEILADAAI
ncbi:MAG: glycosyltransferase, partial [Salegentibacter mishustinae]|nr:glycosyltransferase [Salegentibacter mishustinae]